MDIEKIDNELYKKIYIEKNRKGANKIWEEIKNNIEILKEAIKPCKDKFKERDTVKGTAICERILLDYKTINQDIYQELINLIYSNKDIARTVLDGASNGGYSYLLMTLFNFNLKLTEEQKAFAVDEAMNKVGTIRWEQRQELFSHKLDEMGITDKDTMYLETSGSINPIGKKTGMQYFSNMLTAMGREQAHGTGEFDIRYHVLRNPNWTIEEKQKLIMDFWSWDKEYENCLEQWEWGIVNDDANLKDSVVSPLEPYFLYLYTYNALLRFYENKETTDRIWDEINFCRQMRVLRPIKYEEEIQTQKTKRA